MRRFFALALLVSTPVWAFAAPVIPSAEDREKLTAAIDAIDVVRAQDQAQGRGIMQDIESQIGLPFVSVLTVAVKAVFGQNWANISIKVYRFLSDREAV